MPRRSTIRTSPFTAPSEEPALPRTLAAPLTRSPGLSPAGRAMSAWAAWLAAGFEASVELQNGLVHANLAVLDSAWRGYAILAREWPYAALEAHRAVLDAFGAGLSD